MYLERSVRVHVLERSVSIHVPWETCHNSCILRDQMEFIFFILDLATAWLQVVLFSEAGLAALHRRCCPLASIAMADIWVGDLPHGVARRVLFEWFQACAFYVMCFDHLTFSEADFGLLPHTIVLKHRGQYSQAAATCHLEHLETWPSWAALFPSCLNKCSNKLTPFESMQMF